MIERDTLAQAATSLRLAALRLDELLSRSRQAATADWQGRAARSAVAAVEHIARQAWAAEEFRRLASAIERHNGVGGAMVEWSAAATAAIIRTVGLPNVTRLAPDGRGVLADVFQSMKSGGPPKDHFRIIQSNTDPPRLIIVLAGVQDLSTAVSAGPGAIREIIDRPKGTPRDLAVAIPQVITNSGDYVKRVEHGVARYLTAHGLPPATKVVVIGHSHGAITAIDLAGRNSFNGGVARVTHVIAAGGGQGGHLDEAGPGTDVLVLTNRADAVSRAIALTDLDHSAYRGIDERFEVSRWVGFGSDAGHDLPRYVALAGGLDGRGKRFVDEAFVDLAGATFDVTDVSLLTA